MDYKLYNNDCIEAMKGIPNGSIDLVLTDPPYGTTACKWDSVIPFEPMWKEIKRITKDSSFSVFTSSQPFTTALISSNIDNFKYCWVWEKNRATNFPNAKRRPLTAHEDIIVFNKGSIWYNPQKTTGHTPQIRQKVQLRVKYITAIQSETMKEGIPLATLEQSLGLTAREAYTLHRSPQN